MKSLGFNFKIGANRDQNDIMFLCLIKIPDDNCKLFDSTCWINLFIKSSKKDLFPLKRNKILKNSRKIFIMILFLLEELYSRMHQ